MQQCMNKFVQQGFVSKLDLWPFSVDWRIAEGSEQWCGSLLVGWEATTVRAAFESIVSEWKLEDCGKE